MKEGTVERTKMFQIHLLIFLTLSCYFSKRHKNKTQGPLTFYSFHHILHIWMGGDGICSGLNPGTAQAFMEPPS